MEPIPDPSTGPSRRRSVPDASRVEEQDRLRHYELILERAPVLIAYVDDQRRFRFASQAYCDRHHIQRGEINGRCVTEVLSQEAVSGLEPRIDAALRGEEQEFEMVVRNRAGEARWVNASYVPDRAADGRILGFFAFVRDVHERKAALESRDRFRYAIDQGMEGFALHDKDGKFTYVNPAQAAMYGYPPEELLGNSWRVFYDAESIEEIETVHFPVLLRDGAWRGELVGCRKNGEAFDVEVALTLLQDDRGEPCGLVCNCRDITERKLAEASLRHLHKMEVLGQLTGGIAHDFNNLLTVILGNLDLMRHQAPGNALLEHALEAVQRGTMLTKRLLTFSRKQPLRPQAVNLDKLIRGMADLMRRTLGERIEIEIGIGDALWLCDSDPSVLENVVLNLAVNARDAMPRGGTLTIGAANVDAADMARVSGSVSDSLAGTEDFVRLTVADTGIGMTEAVQRQIFDPFFTTKAPGRGSGLGLSMARDFVRQSGGHISLESEVGKGTSFHLYLRGSHEAESPAEPETASATPVGRREAIMVAEDDPNVRRLIVKLLRGLGYQAFAVEGSAEVLRRFSQQQADLLITDVVLHGDLSGPELASRVWRQHPEANIVFISGDNEHLHLDPPLADRRIHLIPKPFTRHELAQAVRRALKRATNANSLD